MTDIITNLRNGRHCGCTVTLAESKRSNFTGRSQLQFVLIQISRVEINPELAVAIGGKMICSLINTAAFVCRCKGHKITFTAGVAVEVPILPDPAHPIPIILISQLALPMLPAAPENREFRHSIQCNLHDHLRIRSCRFEFFAFLDILQKLHSFLGFRSDVPR